MLRLLVTGAGNNVQAAVTGQAAHVNDAVDVVLAQYLPTVSCLEVSQVDTVHDPGDDWFQEAEALQLPWFWFTSCFGSGISTMVALLRARNR